MRRKIKILVTFLKSLSKKTSEVSNEANRMPKQKKMIASKKEDQREVLREVVIFGIIFNPPCPEFPTSIVMTIVSPVVLK